MTTILPARTRLAHALRGLFGLALPDNDPLAPYWSAHATIKRLAVCASLLVMFGGHTLAWYSFDTGLLIVASAMSLLGLAGLAIIINCMYRILPTTPAPADMKANPDHPRAEYWSTRGTVKRRAMFGFWLAMAAGLIVMALGHNSYLFYVGSAVALAGSVGMVAMEIQMRRALNPSPTQQVDATNPE